MSHDAALFDTVTQLAKQLRNLDAWIAKAVEHAVAKEFDPANYLELRLAPDMFTFRRQVQSACDAAKFVPARLTGRDAPKHEDGPQSLDELRARIADVIAYLEGFEAKDFDGAAERAIAMPFLGEKKILGKDYLTELALPNHTFHLTLAYAILRHAGVALGKRDFIGGLRLVD
mgnify:CR=1 FL=1